MSAEAENTIVGSLLYRPELFGQVTLPADAFTDPTLREIYRTMAMMKAEGEPIDVLTLEAKGLHGADLDRLFSIMRRAIGPAFLPPALRLVREAYAARCLKRGLYDAVQGGDDEMLAAAAKAVTEAQRGAAAKMAPLAEILRDTTDQMERAAKGKSDAILCGVSEWDNAIWLEPGQIVIIGARTSTGKTAMVCWLLRRYAGNGVPCAAFILEGGPVVFGRRMLGQEARVNTMAIRSGKVSNEQMGRIVNAVPTLAQLPITVDTSTIALSEITAEIRRLKHRKGIKLAVVDYLQRVRGTAGLSEYDRVNEVLGELDAVAREDPPIGLIVPAQINREPTRGSDKRPKPNHLQGAGTIEQIVDYIALLYRGFLDDEFANEPTELDIIFAKAREGQQQTQKWIWDYSNGLVVGPEVDR